MRSINILAVLMVCTLGVAPAWAQTKEAGATEELPPSLYELQMIQPEVMPTKTDESLPIDIRKDALREAGFSFGARGGLATRTWQIREELESRAAYLDKIYDFRQLLIPTDSGLLIEPPVVSESLDALNIDGRGLSAAVSEAVYNIGKNARIVSAPRTWRAYLEREWDMVDPPPDILRPASDDERKQWTAWVEQGWNEGIAQADEIFQEDLNRLTADYRGMVRYRTLLAQGMVSSPYALQIDRGVTGGGEEMRVGDRALSITGLPAFKPDSSEWQPANR